MTDTRSIAPATLTQSLNALEVVKTGNAKKLHDAGMITTAIAHIAITDNAVRATLELAFAVRAALDGDLEPARNAMRDLRLDQVEFR